MEIGAGYRGVIYFCNGFGEYYRIDLNCLPERLSSIANFTAEKSVGWTVIDECIYCIGGMKGEYSPFTVGMNLNKFTPTTNSNSTWELILPHRNLRWYNPFVFAFGRKIYVISGNKLIPDCKCESPDWTYLGEYYNLDSQTWTYLPKLTQHSSNIDESLSAFGIHAVMDKTTIVFYIVFTGLLLLYDLHEEKWIHEEELHHPNMKLAGSDLFEQCAGGETLSYIANNIKAVVCDSTLYWLNNDLCLYGYDYVQMRWFQSNSLEGELTWQLFLDPKYLVYIPLLFYLDNETFVAICRVTNEELGMAIIGVKREPLSLNVSLKFSRNFPVDTSAGDGVDPYSGMAM
uniref:Uncharacterized protein n=1 Tax=Solanum tuberosum TaxID=4113 RepID=M1DHE8_SOLTU